MQSRIAYSNDRNNVSPILAKSFNLFSPNSKPFRLWRKWRSTALAYLRTGSTWRLKKYQKYREVNESNEVKSSVTTNKTTLLQVEVDS